MIATSAGHLFSLIGSARLHSLDPETHLRDVTRVLAQRPKDRHLELVPKYWAATRARLDADELEQEVGWLNVPPPLSAEWASLAIAPRPRLPDAARRGQTRFVQRLRHFR